jgi:hypothetical protein
VATKAAWLNGEKRQKLMERAKKLLTGAGLLMEGIFAVGGIPSLVRSSAWPTRFVVGQVTKGVWYASRISKWEGG